MEDKKNTLANTHASQKTQRQDTTPAVFSQQLANLPEEILSQPRFFAVKKNKEPKAKGWSNPKNQKLYSEIQGLVGFDTAGHNAAADYLFLDFDHVLNDQCEFVTAVAEECFNRTQNYLKTYCELSASGHGIHIIAKPTAGKFKKVSSGENGRIYFDAEKKSFLEIFYGTGGRYCLFTGNVFRCEPKTPIAHGEPVDGVFQNLLDVIAKRTKKSLKSAQETKETKPISDSADYDLFRAKIMLDAIKPADLADNDWLAVISSCKHIGIAYPVVDAWNQRDPERYNEEENKMRRDSATDPHFGIETLHGIAKRFGYVERDTRREWYNLHPDLKPQKNSDTSNAPMSDDGAEENFIGTRDKIKSCPVNLKIPDNYLFQKSGITLVVPPKSEKGETKYICAARTPIIPTKKFREPVKGTLEYEFAILDGEKWRKVEIDGAALADTRDLSKTLSKYGAQIKKGENLREFFIDVLSLNPELRELKSYSQTGWTTEDCEEFAYPSHDGNAIIRRAGYDYERIFKPRGDRDAWKKKFGEVTEQGGARAQIIIGFAAAAPLIKPLEDLPNLQLHIWGKKSIGKTPMLKFAVSIFGNTDVDNLTHTFAATPKARLETACAFSDLPLICEELESIGAKDAEKLSTDIYNYFLGIGGQALNKDGTKRNSKIFSGGRLTSGEHSLVQSCGNGGEFKRVLDLRCASLLEEDFASDLYGFCKRNCGLFGEEWIRYTIEHRDEISKDYHRILDAVKYEQKIKGDENDLTQLRTLVISAVAFQHFKICIGLQDCVNLAELAQDIDEIAAALPTAAEMDDTARAIEFLCGFIAGHEKYFYSKAENTDEILTVGFASEYYGLRLDDTEYAFFKPALKKILEEHGGFKSAEKIIAEFYDKGFLITNNGRKDHVIKFGKKAFGVYHFKANTLAQNYEDAELKHYGDLGVL